MPDDVDANVVEIVVREVRDVGLRVRQRVAQVAARLAIEELPASLGGVVDRAAVAGDEVVEGRIEGRLRPFVGGDGPEEIRAVGLPPEDAAERALIRLVRGDPGHRRLQGGLAHLDRVDDGQRRLLFERVHAPVPELRLVVEGVEDRGRIALAGAAVDADRGRQSVREGSGGIVARAAGHRPAGRETAVEEQPLAESDLRGSLRIVRRDQGTRGVEREAELLERSGRGQIDGFGNGPGPSGARPRETGQRRARDRRLYGDPSLGPLPLRGRRVWLCDLHR